MGIEAELGRANVAIRATLDKLDGDLGEARGKVDSAIERIVGGAGKAFQGLGTVALGAIGVATGAVVGLGAALAKITIDAAPVEGISQAFDGLATSAGVGTDEMLAALKRGSAGMVSNRDLMLSFNKAAALVSVDFAQQLPDAMQYLGKVSASTGQDMGFMLDSLVKGVGRLSPMILDNLGIQVTLADATDRAAQMFGVQAEELTKDQVQAGMMNVVLEKLAENTASMPDVTESAAAKMARFRATIQDTKDAVGMALLPTLTKLMGTGQDLAERALPLLTGFIEGTLVPIFEKAATFVNAFVYGLTTGEGPLQAFKGALQEIVPDELSDAIQSIYLRIQELWAMIQPIIEQVGGWISRNVELKDVLIVLGAAIAGVVLPALWSVVAAVAPVIAVFVAAVAIVALLRQAWENDWLGIRTSLTEAWENTIKPALAALWEWLKVNVPAAIQTLRDFWVNVLWPAVRSVIDFFTGSVVPVFTTVANTARTVVGTAVTALADLWRNVLKPALSLVWGFIQNSVIPLFNALADVASAVVGVAITALAGIWQNVLRPALDAVWGFIQNSVIPVFERVAKIVTETLGPPLQWLADTLLPPIRDAFDRIKDAISAVIDWINKMADAIRNIDLPDWLTPGSATPFEAGLRGIGQAMHDLARMRVPELSAELRNVYEVEASGAGPGGGQQIVIYGLTLEGVQDARGLLGELQALAV